MLHRRLFYYNLHSSRCCVASRRCHYSTTTSFKLTDQQQQIYDAAVHDASRPSIFLTGGSGTGKSTLLQAIHKGIEERIETESAQTRRAKGAVYMTAPQWLSSLKCQGVTLHNFGSIAQGMENNIQDKPADYEWQRMGSAVTRIIECDALLIEEVAGMTSSLFEAIDFMCKRYRANTTPFGGIQVIMSGDFCSLPPSRRLSRALYPFHSLSWGALNPKIEVLGDPLRFADDVPFASFLQSLRKGEPKVDFFVMSEGATTTPATDSKVAGGIRCLDRALGLLGSSPSSPLTKEELSSKLDSYFASPAFTSPASPPPPIRICALSPEEDRINEMNEKRVKEIAQEKQEKHDEELELSSATSVKRNKKYFSHFYKAKLFGPTEDVYELYSFVPNRLELCVGSRVMLLKDSDNDYKDEQQAQDGQVNQAFFDSVTKRPRKILRRGALGTVIGFDCDVMSEVREYQRRQLSDPDNHEGSSSSSPTDIAALQHRRKLELGNKNDVKVFPVVQFDDDEGTGGRLIVPTIFDMRHGKHSYRSVTQLPLRHGWAITINKIQGLEFPRAHVDLASVYDVHQAYVSLSRVRRSDRVTVSGLSMDPLRGCPVARAFYYGEKKAKVAESPPVGEREQSK